MKFKCNNPECKKFDLVDEIQRTQTIIKPDGTKFVKQSICSSCRREREDISNYALLSEKNIYIAEVASMNTQQRAEVLKKRSHEHFNKNVKGRKDHLLNQAMSEMRGKKL